MIQPTNVRLVTIAQKVLMQWSHVLLVPMVLELASMTRMLLVRLAQITPMEQQKSVLKEDWMHHKQLPLLAQLDTIAQIEPLLSLVHLELTVKQTQTISPLARLATTSLTLPRRNVFHAQRVTTVNCQVTPPTALTLPRLASQATTVQGRPQTTLSTHVLLELGTHSRELDTPVSAMTVLRDTSATIQLSPASQTWSLPTNVQPVSTVQEEQRLVLIVQQEPTVWIRSLSQPTVQLEPLVM